jgi:hypothetical protein
MDFEETQRETKSVYTLNSVGLSFVGKKHRHSYHPDDNVDSIGSTPYSPSFRIRQILILSVIANGGKLSVDEDENWQQDHSPFSENVLPIISRLQIG